MQGQIAALRDSYVGLLHKTFDNARLSENFGLFIFNV
jgi:hypothetical protein